MRLSSAHTVSMSYGSPFACRPKQMLCRTDGARSQTRCFRNSYRGTLRTRTTDAGLMPVRRAISRTVRPFLRPLRTSSITAGAIDGLRPRPDASFTSASTPPDSNRRSHNDAVFTVVPSLRAIRDGGRPSAARSTIRLRITTRAAEVRLRAHFNSPARSISVMPMPPRAVGRRSVGISETAAVAVASMTVRIHHAVPRRQTNVCASEEFEVCAISECPTSAADGQSGRCRMRCATPSPRRA